jgi:phage/plasmid-associated DNA primase
MRDFNVKKCRQHLPIITGIEKALKLIRDAIWDANQTMRQELEQSDAEFAAKSQEDKKKSLMATWCQTKERIIQEECIAYLVRNFPSVKLSDIISCQDGMMVLEKQMKGINLELLFECFTELIKRKLGIKILWTKKELDEAFSIPSVSTMPIDVTLDDLKKGECHIAELIAPAFKSTFKYYNVEKESWWYILNPKTKVWEKQVKPETAVIITTLQYYISEEIIRVTGLMNKETDKDQKTLFKREITELEGQLKATGKGSYTKQLINEFLSYHLKDNKFPEKLDKTIGKLVFNDCILDLKTNETKPITPEDYISFTNDIDYLSLKEPDESNQQRIRHEFKKIFNNKDTHLEYGMGAFGYSLTGDASREKAIFYLKDGSSGSIGNNGKSFLFKILRRLFPKLVAEAPFKAFLDGFANSHKFIDGWHNIRILYCGEVKKQKVNAELIKSIGDGDEYRYERLFATTGLLVMMFKLFLCSNVELKVGKEEAGSVFNRVRALELLSNFDTQGKTKVEDYENLKFIANPLLEKELLENFRDDLYHFFIGYAIKYYKVGLPPLPVEFAVAAEKEQLKNNDFAVWFYKKFEMTGDDKDRLSMDDIMRTSFQGLDRDGMLKEIKGLGIEYKKDLKGFGKKEMMRNGEKIVKDIVGGIVGIKRKDDDDDDEN